MDFYLLLTSATAVIVLLAWLVWSRTHHISFPLGIGLIYYWSLFGAWSIVGDRLGGENGKRYDYLEAKLFPIMLDADYLMTLLLYAAFIILIEIALLMFLKPRPVSDETLQAPVDVSHGVFLLLAVLCGLGSYGLIREYLEMADSMNLSAYMVTRGGLGELPPYFTIHQLLSRGALLSAAIGVSIVCSGGGARLFVGAGGWAVKAGYMAVVAGLFWFALILGNKNELLFAGIGGVLLYLANARRPQLVALSLTAVVGFIGLWLVDTLRGLPLAAVAGGLQDLEPSHWLEAAQFVTSSNEAFSAHFSLYGALALNVPLTYGESVVSVVASVIPRFAWPDRPPDIYLHYADSIGVAEGQGFTIHHATGWYLNFGMLGILIGALLWGWIWAKCYANFHRGGLQQSRFWMLWTRIAPWMFVASIPMLIRAGFEGYKALLVEAFFLPTMILLLASYDESLLQVFLVNHTRRAASLAK
ncbi:MAG: hypothetical protein HY348_07120 [Nitrospira defluvii]|nr:hypothetical protein [Nitrospira defluvii]